MNCGFGIGYGIDQKYLPIWVLVSVSDLNQNSGFSRTLILSQFKQKKINIRNTNNDTNNHEVCIPSISSILLAVPKNVLPYSFLIITSFYVAMQCLCNAEQAALGGLRVFQFALVGSWTTWFISSGEENNCTVVIT